MSDSLPSSVVKATKGDYDISIKNLWIETWRQLIQMPKTFWQGFGLVLLGLLGTTIFMSLLVRWGGMGILHFQNYRAQLPNLHTLHVLNILDALFMSFIGAVIQVLRTLFTVSLAFLALHQIRNRPIKVTLVFSFCKNWRSLLFISILFYLLSRTADYGLFFVFRPLQQQDLSKPIFALGAYANTFLLILLNSYFMLIAFMASLLSLDQKMTFKKSVCVALKSINRYTFKNMPVLFLASLAYIGAEIDLGNLLFSTLNGFNLYFYYLVLLPGLILAILFVTYKIIAFKNKPSRIKNITLMALRFMLGLLILGLFYLGGGLIWLLPVVSLLLAIQYQHIFLDKSLSYV